MTSGSLWAATLLGLCNLVSLAHQEQFFLTVPDIFHNREISTLCQNIRTDVSETTEDMKPFALLGDLEL